MHKGNKQNSAGVPRNPNRPLTTISHPSSPGAFCKPDADMIALGEEYLAMMRVAPPEPFIKYELSQWECLPMRQGDCITFPTDAQCPICHSQLLSEGKITYAYPFDDLMEAHVTSLGLRCTNDGCDYHKDCKAAQPELQNQNRGSLAN
jgi:hypothetical protein